MPGKLTTPAHHPARLATSLLLLTLLAACGSGPTRESDPLAGAAPIGCAQLQDLRIPAAAIGLPTSGARVTAAEPVAANGAGAKAVGAYCKVSAEIAPVDPKAPAIRFQLDLPTQWNRKALMFGGGGYDGTIPDVAANVPAGPATLPAPWAVAATPPSPATRGIRPMPPPRAMVPSVPMTRPCAILLVMRSRRPAMRRWPSSPPTTPPGRRDLFCRRLHRWPRRAGRGQPLAGRFRWRHCALPGLERGGTGSAIRPHDARHGPAGRLCQPQKRKLLYDAAMAACDKLDGVVDGIISNVDACNASFDPATAVLNGAPLRCPGGADAGDQCLSDAQIATFKVFSTPLVLPYALASGETSYPGFNTWGTNWGTGGDAMQAAILTLGLGTVQPANPMPGVSAQASPPYHSTFWDQWVRYFVTRDASFNPLALDPQQPGPYQARILQLNAWQDANQADLSAFRDKGGKILIAHGSADALVSTRPRASTWSACVRRWLRAGR
jgi:feruloyl esterase